MSAILFYDTETTGLPLWCEPSEDPRQPHITQIAALLTDEAGNKLGSIDLLVKPDGWTIPEDLQRLTGITMEKAEAGGVPEADALAAFTALWKRADVRIAHNEPFDARIVRIGLHRFPCCDPEAWSAGKAACTQRLSTPILKLPPTEKMLAAGFNRFKSANLAEAYRHFIGKELNGAHNAMVDVLAVKAVYLKIQKAAETEAQQVYAAEAV